MSAQFTKNAQKVATANVASVKTQKDMGKPKKESESRNMMEDMVTLSSNLSDAKKSNLAAQSGVASEAAKKEKKQDADELSMFGGQPHMMEQEALPFAPTPEEEKAAKEMEAVGKAKAHEVMNRSADEIMKDVPKGFEVPEGFATAAKRIVEGQIEKGKPTDSLTNLKDVPDNSLVMPDLKPVQNIDIAPIHDSANKPLPLDMGAMAARQGV
jgi:hypothetical protein